MQNPLHGDSVVVAIDGDLHVNSVIDLYTTYSWQKKNYILLLLPLHCEQPLTFLL